MKRKLIVLLAAVCLLTACSKTTTTTSTDSEKDANQNTSQASGQTEETETYGKVISIDGNNITLAIGTLNMKQMPSGEGPQDGQTPPDNSSNAPEKPSGEVLQDGETPPDNGSDNGNVPGKPLGEMPQDGQVPSDNGENQEMELLTLIGEEKTIVISDESLITKQNGQESSGAELTDIEVGNILKVTSKAGSDGNEAITGIEILNRGNNPSMNNSAKNFANEEKD